MEAKYYLPNFKRQYGTVKDTGPEMELFQKLYREKSEQMGRITVLNFYGPSGVGKARLMRAIYNKIGSLNTSPAISKAIPPVAIYCNMVGGISTMVSGIVKQASQKYGFAFPLASICLYILSRSGKEENGSSSLLPDLLDAATCIENEPEFQYLKQALDPVPLDQSGFHHLYSRLLLDDQAPRSLRQLAETKPGLLESLVSWPMRQTNPQRRLQDFFFSCHYEQPQKSRPDYLAAFFTSFFAADMEENLNGHKLPAVILLDGIDKLIARTVPISEQAKREKWLYGTTGLLATFPKTLWVSSSHKRLDWEKDYLPDWKDALIQKAITVPDYIKQGIPDLTAKFDAAIWKQQKSTLAKKIQYVLQGLEIFDLDIAVKACTALLDEYQDIPGFETACLNSIMEFTKILHKDLLPGSSKAYLSSNIVKDFYFCSVPETPCVNKEQLKYRFRAFDFAQQYYTAMINKIHLGKVDFEDPLDVTSTIWEYILARQIRAVEKLIENTQDFANEEKSIRKSLQYFYFTAVIPQVLDWIDLGLYNTAERILEKVQNISPNNDEMLCSVYGLGDAYLQKARDNNCAKAAKRIERIYNENIAVAGKEDPVSIFLLNILSYVRSFIPGEELAAYRERRERAIILKRVLGKKNQKTLSAISILGPHLVENGRTEAAKTVNHICYHYAAQLYGENDLATLICASQYAHRLNEAGQKQDSFKLRKLVAGNYEKIYGEFAPDTLSELEALADVLCDLSKEDFDDEQEVAIPNHEAKEKELRIREDLLNRYLEILQEEKQENNRNAHPLIRDAVINVCDSMYNSKHNIDEIMQFAVNHLGENDPGIISILINASSNESINGENETAIKTIQRAIELCKKQGVDTYGNLEQYITCRLYLSWFLSQNNNSTKEENLALYKSIAEDCEKLMAIAEKDGSIERVNESKIYSASRCYKVAQYANYYYDENEFALEVLDKAIGLKQSVSAVQDEELLKYLELKKYIVNEMD